jgi:ketosteroid isomerase-like protein
MDLDAAWGATLPAGDPEAFLARVAQDAIFASARILAGREEVWSSWRRFFEKGGPTLRWTPTDGGMAPSGDLGWTVGSFRFEGRTTAGDALVSEGRYASVWSRGSDGPWLVALDGGLEAPGASAGAPRRILRTLASRDGSLEASMGTWERAGPEAPVRGAWLSVRQRSTAGWRVVVESELSFPPARP